MEEITKESVYQDMLDMYRACGQGNHITLFESLGLDAVVVEIDKLIKEGLVIKQSEGQYENWVYLAKAPYCPESELDMSGLFNIRRFMGIEESVFGQHTDDKSYNEWLEKTGITMEKVNSMLNYSEL